MLHGENLQAADSSTKCTGWCLHSFRHTVADSFNNQECNEAVIAEILGHRNESITTGRYRKRFHPVLFQLKSLRLALLK
ncbi:MAG: tyrosine-type recombinase/integrase [Desulfuromonadales bacterium]|nr:tyrosine-type recombinase/integrase [Desulfuromonadales bacterium]